MDYSIRSRGNNLLCLKQYLSLSLSLSLSLTHSHSLISLSLSQRYLLVCDGKGKKYDTCDPRTTAVILQRFSPAVRAGDQ